MPALSWSLIVPICSPNNQPGYNGDDIELCVVGKITSSTRRSHRTRERRCTRWRRSAGARCAERAVAITTAVVAPASRTTTEVISSAGRHHDVLARSTVTRRTIEMISTVPTYVNPMPTATASTSAEVSGL